MMRVISSCEKPHIDGAKRIADLSRYELGFLTRQAFQESADHGELLVALDENNVIGFVRFHHRKDRHTTLYEIAVAPERRQDGVGKALVEALIVRCQASESTELVLKCPVELQANSFYERLGFRRCGNRSTAGRGRRLFVWTLPIALRRRLTFVASLTASTNDLWHL
jgi:N-acetylglutamate synthase-like GNAT family acetyltransferase